MSIPELLHSFTDAGERDETAHILAKDYANATRAVGEVGEIGDILPEDGAEYRVGVRVRRKRYANPYCNSNTCTCFAVCNQNCECTNHCVCSVAGCRLSCLPTQCFCACQGSIYGQYYGCTSFACSAPVCYAV